MNHENATHTATFAHRCSIRPSSIVQFDLIGTAGPGLFGTSPPCQRRHGWEIGAGITYDDVANLLDRAMSAGAVPAFTDLSSTPPLPHPRADGHNFNDGTGIADDRGSYHFTRSRRCSYRWDLSQAATSPYQRHPHGSAGGDLMNGRITSTSTQNNSGGRLRQVPLPVPNLPPPGS